MTDHAVFFPALMAVGILVSGAMIVGDWVSALLPSREARRRQVVTRRALALVRRIAATTGSEVVALPIAARVARARRFYLVVAVVCASLGALAVRYGEVLYQDPLGWLRDNPWTLALGYGFGGTLLVIGVITLVPAAVTLQSGRVVRALVEHTWLGKPALPPQDPRQLLRSKGGVA
jgi:hypothetical protein